MSCLDFNVELFFAKEAFPHHLTETNQKRKKIAVPIHACFLSACQPAPVPSSFPGASNENDRWMSSVHRITPTVDLRGRLACAGV